MVHFRITRALHPVLAFAVMHFRITRAPHPVLAFAVVHSRIARALHVVLAFAVVHLRVASTRRSGLLTLHGFLLGSGVRLGRVVAPNEALRRRRAGVGGVLAFAMVHFRITRALHPVLAFAVVHCRIARALHVVLAFAVVHL